MPPESRALLAAFLLAIFGYTLTPRATPAAETNEGAEVEGVLTASRAAFDTRNWQAALEPTRTLVERFPKQQVFSERLARIYSALGDPVKEADAWEKFVGVSPTPEDACPAIAEAYWKAGDHDKSLEASVRCRDYDPMSGELHYYLGRAYERANRPADARTSYDAALRVEPPHVDTRVALASMLLREGQNKAAFDVISPALPVNPDNADVLLMVGISELRLGRRVEARRALERAATLSPQYGDVQLVLGVLEFTEGRAAIARQHFEKVAQIDPARRDVDVWLQRTGASR